jgi:preprotein translocase subunit YajC
VFWHAAWKRRIEAKLDALLREVQRMSKQMDDLAAAVKKNDDVVDSAVTLITGLAAQLLAAKDDPVAIEALANEVSAKADALAAAVTANTPAAV